MGNSYAKAVEQGLKHGPDWNGRVSEKWVPVFRKDRAQKIS